MASNVDEAIAEAVRASRASYQAAGITVDLDLRATVRPVTADPVLRATLNTIFRALPERLAPGSRLRVRTSDRAGGDVELVVEADWLPRASRAHSDLVDLAVDGLLTICRVRSGRVDLTDGPDGAGPRRQLFLIPSLERAPSWHPTRAP